MIVDVEHHAAVPPLGGKEALKKPERAIKKIGFHGMHIIACEHITSLFSNGSQLLVR